MPPAGGRRPRSDMAQCWWSAATKSMPRASACSGVAARRLQTSTAGEVITEKLSRKLPTWVVSRPRRASTSPACRSAASRCAASRSMAPRRSRRSLSSQPQVPSSARISAAARAESHRGAPERPGTLADRERLAGAKRSWRFAAVAGAGAATGDRATEGAAAAGVAGADPGAGVAAGSPASRVAAWTAGGAATAVGPAAPSVSGAAAGDGAAAGSCPARSGPASRASSRLLTSGGGEAGASANGIRPRTSW